jgi:two-component system, NarL family, response regulator NreC
MPIRVFLVDDHKIFRQGLRGLLAEEQDLTIVGEAEDGRDAITQIAKLRPDVAIMDVGMPALNGIEATRQIKRDFPKTQVIALSMHVDEKFVAEMLRAGAVGYLCKQCDADELVTAIRTAVAGQTYLSPSISGTLVAKYVRNVTAEPASAFSRLTDREREILQLLVEEKTIKEIASDLHLSIKTVHAHREHLMQKLNVQTLSGLTKYAVREGLTEL